MSIAGSWTGQEVRDEPLSNLRGRARLDALRLRWHERRTVAVTSRHAVTRRRLHRRVRRLREAGYDEAEAASGRHACDRGASCRHPRGQHHGYRDGGAARRGNDGYRECGLRKPRRRRPGRHPRHRRGDHTRPGRAPGTAARRRYVRHRSGAARSARKSSADEAWGKPAGGGSAPVTKRRSAARTRRPEAPSARQPRAPVKRPEAPAAQRAVDAVKYPEVPGHVATAGRLRTVAPRAPRKSS